MQKTGQNNHHTSNLPTKQLDNLIYNSNVNKFLIKLQSIYSNESTETYPNKYLIFHPQTKPNQTKHCDNIQLVTKQQNV